MTMRKPVFVLALLLASAGMSGCEHLSHTAGKADDKATASDSKLSDAIASAAADAENGGMTQESLMFQERLYKDDPHDGTKILNYAKALRYNGRIDDAILVIRTPSKGPRATEPMMTEAAMDLISGGHYDEALEFAQKAVEKNDKSPDAHHALALALAGLGKFEDAQLQFEKTIELWPEGRDQTPVINNLAMDLAAQGKVKEAREAMAMATGEALSSPTYQNNRAMLDALKDHEPVKKEELAPVIKQPVLVHEDIAPKGAKAGKPVMIVPAPTAVPVAKTPGKMQPIVE